MYTRIGPSVVLITGSTDGLGLALACAMAGTGIEVLLHGRNEARCRVAADEIARQSGNDRLRWYAADLSSLDETRSMAEAILTRETRLDTLVSNAGIGTVHPGSGRRLVSRDGIELRFAVNYLAGCLLVEQLIPLLSENPLSRIVQVVSNAQAAIDFDDLMMEQHYDGGVAYRRSKLAQIIFTFDCARSSGNGPTVNSVHPAKSMPTKMILDAGKTPVDSLKQGVDAVARLIVDPGLTGVSGQYFDGQVPAVAHPQAYETAARHRLRLATRSLLQRGSAVR